MHARTDMQHALQLGFDCQAVAHDLRLHLHTPCIPYLYSCKCVFSQIQRRYRPQATSTHLERADDNARRQ